MTARMVDDDDEGWSTQLRKDVGLLGKDAGLLREEVGLLRGTRPPPAYGARTERPADRRLRPWTALISPRYLRSCTTYMDVVIEAVSRTAARQKSVPPEAAVTGKRRAATGADVAPLILLVDDAEDAREMYGTRLADVGLRVENAVDGEHALWKVDALGPDLVVMDLAMPTLDGWEATRKIKAHPKTRHIPVVALTGHVTPDALRRAREAGADVVLTKPCTPDALLAVIRRLLAR